MIPAPGLLRFEHDRVVSQEALVARGRAARATLSRSAHAVYEPPAERDPLAILDQQHAGRLANLVPLRLERMLQSPFAFYRGTAAIQAADLAAAPTTGAGVVLCGDAHISNFGIFSSPERSLVFDLNDFDEAAFGPWEWDVKRLVTSVVIAARDRGYTAQEANEAALQTVRAYRDSLRSALEQDVTDRFFQARVVQDGREFNKKSQKLVRATIAAAEKRTSARVVSRITEVGTDGSRRLIENPPVLTHVGPEIEDKISEVLLRYRRTLPSNISLLLSQYTATDLARRVVGVGSVGTRCFIAVLTGPRGEPLILQVKEATDSVVNQFGGLPSIASEGVDEAEMAASPGYRVTANQRILQVVSDPFLGYVNLDGFGFYVRQFRDRNASFDINKMGAESFLDYVRSCAFCLGRAHSRSANGAFIVGYLGASDTFPLAIAEWARLYADQSRADYDALVAASGN